MWLGLDQALCFVTRASVLGLLGLWLSAGAWASSSVGGSLLSGQVLDEKGTPVGGAHLVLTGPMAAGQLVARADASGRFEFRTLSPGSYRIEAIFEGFFPARQEIKIGDENLEVELVLTPRREIGRAHV